MKKRVSVAAKLLPMVLLAGTAGAEEARHWGVDTVTIAVHAGGGFDVDEVVDIVTLAADAWNGTGEGPILVVEVGEGSADVAIDGVNRLFFVDDNWTHDANELALTFSAVPEGERVVQEADIAVNAADHDYRAGQDEAAFDLQNMLAHELGHFLGIRHLEAEVATMFPEINAGEIEKRDLSDDDAQALKEAYEGVEFESSDAGCSATGGTGISPLFILGIFLIRLRTKRGR